jgi:hypothetical protein
MGDELGRMGVGCLPPSPVTVSRGREGAGDLSMRTGAEDRAPARRHAATA